MSGQLILIALGCQIRFPFIAVAIVIAHRFNYTLSHFVLVPLAIYGAENGRNSQFRALAQIRKIDWDFPHFSLIYIASLSVILPNIDVINKLLTKI